MQIYLVPLGRGRYELYTEPVDDAPDAGDSPPGFWRQRLAAIRRRWSDAVRQAREGAATGWMARARDWAVRRTAETIAEQRTLWSLGRLSSAEMLFPSDLSESTATAERLQLLMRARRHHGFWLIVDGVLFVVSGVFVIVPGPNALAYYLGLRLLGHFLSWRGAKHGLERTVWTARSEPALAELGRLAHLPRESRAPRVQAIAAALKLPRLVNFFDRAAI